MKSPKWLLILIVVPLVLCYSSCSPNKQPVGLTPIPSLASRATETLLPAIASQGGIHPVSAGPDQGSSAMGAAIYMKYCAQCHGNLGQGITGPELRGDQFFKTSDDSAVYTKIAIGDRKDDKVMPGWLIVKSGPLTSDDINHVIAYLRTIQDEDVLPTSTPLPPPSTETPLPVGAATPEPEGPAQPSNPGGPGEAVNLTGNASSGKVLFGNYCAACHGPEGIVPVPNPGSDDGVVPQLNPIDDTIVNADIKTYTQNVDLFIEHGSVPSGDAVQINMPDFGDKKYLVAQELSDIIAYVISLNPPQ
jgi:mono/diheme cytochrome c family protein